MKKITLFLMVQLLGAAVFAQYKPVDEGSKVTFKIKNFGFNTEGNFKGLQGEIRFDPKDAANASFDVSVDAASVNTDNDSRDEHLRKETYFDTGHFPRIRLVSEKITAGGEGYTFSGKLTIKGKTQELSFPFTAEPSGSGYLFKGEFKINRKDFGVGGSSTISDNLTVTLSVLGRK